MTYYKVVKCKKDDTLNSYFVSNSGLNVEYKPNEWVSADLDLLAKGYGLFVFNTLERAKYEIEYEKGIFDKSLQIWTCEVADIQAKNVHLYFEDDYWQKDFIIQHSKTYDESVCNVSIVGKLKLLERVQ
jgi:hypothetical protein